MGVGRDLTRGLIAGAAGTLVLNALTYADMAVRARPSSSVPARTVRELVGEADVELAPDGDEEAARNRSEGLGALMGYASGLGFGALYGLVATRIGDLPLSARAAGLTVAAMAGANAPATAAGVTDPREWSAQAWMADIIPHVAYGLVTAAAHAAMSNEYGASEGRSSRLDFSAV